MKYKRYTTYSANRKYAAVKVCPPGRRGNPSKSRGKRANPTNEAVVKRNKRALTMRLWSLIVSNFDESDYFIGLTYSDTNLPESEEAAKEHFKKFKRKLKRKAKQKGIQLRMIWVTETGRNNRPHHHIIINKEVPTDLIFDLWRNMSGGIIEKTTVLRREAGKSPDFYDLASYIVKEKTADYNRDEDLSKQAYSRTRNLQKPYSDEEDINRQYVHIPAGYELVPGSEEWYTDSLTGLTYLEYRIMANTPKPKKRRRRGKRVPTAKVYDLKRAYIEEQLSLL